MRRAFENGARRIWIANVGDIKPGEYLMEFFLGTYFLDTHGGSETWKENVLRNYLPVRTALQTLKAGEHTLRLTANRNGIVIDQIALIPEGTPAFYEIPA